jgi:ABC-type antimicrobial peptide transport system permease subunit
MLASASRRISSALLLFSTIGIDDVISRSVTQRAPGIGIWTALGASRGTVLWLILRHGLLLTALGLVLGTGGALVLTQLLSSLLFGVGGRDAPTRRRWPAFSASWPCSPASFRRGERLKSIRSWPCTTSETRPPAGHHCTVNLTGS